MSDPKKPEKVEDIKPSKDTARTDETAVPAAANTNEKAEKPVEPVSNVTPIDVTPKKDPIVSVPVPPVTPAADAPVNDNATNQPAAEVPLVKDAKPAAVAEVKPVETSPADPVADQAAAEAPAPAKKGFLKKAFNFAVKAGVGAAVTATLKTAAVVGAGIAGAPVWATVLISGLAVGVGATLVHDAFERRQLKKEGKELSPYFSKAHGKKLVSKKSLKTFGFSTVAAIAGSMLYMGFHEGIIQGWWNHMMGHAPAAPVAPVAVAPVVAPVEVAPPAPVEHVVAPVAPVEHVVQAPPVAPVVAAPPCVAPIDQFHSLVDGHHVSSQVQNAIHRVASTNPRVHAQALKDLAYYSQYGFGGVPKDHHVALELFKQAADLGNTQAKVDMLYLQHYGLDGITPDKASSMSAMKDIAHNARATEFVKAWGGAGKTLPHVDFDTNTILKGMKIGCPAA